MTDNINKLLQNLNGNKQQPTTASLANLTDEGKKRSIWDYALPDVMNETTLTRMQVHLTQRVALPCLSTYGKG